jgi:hypothetical protein
MAAVPVFASLEQEMPGELFGFQLFQKPMPCLLYLFITQAQYAATPACNQFSANLL